MIILAIIFLAIGSIGTLSSAVMEWKEHKEIYTILMKVFPWFIGIGGVLFGLAMAQ